LLVVPLGFWTGTELLNTRPQRSHIAFPIVKEGPWGAANDKRTFSVLAQKDDNYMMATGSTEGCQKMEPSHGCVLSFS
jgi:hypothetical protein